MPFTIVPLWVESVKAVKHLFHEARPVGRLRVRRVRDRRSSLWCVGVAVGPGWVQGGPK